MLNRALEQVRLLARETFKRAAGQRGRVEIPVRLPEMAGHPGNAGTLVELDWSVTRAGIIRLGIFIDGVRIWEGAA